MNFAHRIRAAVKELRGAQPYSALEALEAIARELENDDTDEIPLALINTAPATIGEEIAVLVAASLTSLGYAPIVRWRKRLEPGESVDLMTSTLDVYGAGDSTLEVTTTQAKEREGERYTRTYAELARRTVGWRKK